MNNTNHQSKTINWYPGHMKKAFDEIENRLKIIDVIIEIVDARAPISSKNPFLENIISSKKRILVMSKYDMCDTSKLTPFIEFYQNKGYVVIPYSAKSKENLKTLKKAIYDLGKEKREKERIKGMKPQNIRVMVLGIPNVGKSTLINNLVGVKRASTANKPGHTRAQQLIRVDSEFDLLDTPGILPPHYEDKKIALNLALIGAMPSEILPNSYLCDEALNILKMNYLDKLFSRYRLQGLFKSNYDILKGIAISFGLLLKEGKLDIDSAERLILKDFKEGAITRIIVDELC